MPGFLDPEVIAEIDGLSFPPRSTLLGAPTGAQTVAAKKGASREFSDYRVFTEGDDPRFIDWKAYARKDRYYLRTFEGETSSTLWTLLDASKSMTFTSGRVSKWELACKMALGLTYLALKRRDPCGTMLAGDGPLDMVAAKPGWQTLNACTALLDGFKDFSSLSDFSGSFERLAAAMPRPSLVMVFSDFLGVTAEEAFAGLKALSVRRHEVVAIRILDAAEVDIGLLSPTSERIRVTDVEGKAAEPIDCDLSQIAADYRLRLTREQEVFSALCMHHRIESFTFTTATAAGAALKQLAAWRLGCR
ncbi:MAG: DUF58 domain-containing protein [Elusimicrobiota bacterium]